MRAGGWRTHPRSPILTPLSARACIVPIAFALVLACGAGLAREAAWAEAAPDPLFDAEGEAEAPSGYPDPIDLGIVVDKIGRSSVVYRVGLFQGVVDRAAAEGRFVHVYVDNTDPARPVAPIPDEIRAAVTPLLRPTE